MEYSLALLVKLKAKDEEVVKRKKLQQLNDKKTKALKPSTVTWDTASGIQMKVTTQLRHERENFGDIDSDVLQRNIAKLDNQRNGQACPAQAQWQRCLEWFIRQNRLAGAEGWETIPRR